MNNPTQKSCSTQQHLTRFDFSVFRHTKDPTVHQAKAGLNRLIEYLLEPIRGCDEKGKLPLWSPTTFKANSRRSRTTAECINMLVYDCDDCVWPFDVWRLFAAQGVTTLAHTSWSHTPKKHKYRIILPLKYPIPAGDWDRAHRAAYQYYQATLGPESEPDIKALKDTARVYYRYAIPRNTPNIYLSSHSTGHHIGDLLELDYQHIKIPKRINTRPKSYRDGSVNVRDSIEDLAVRERITSHLGAQVIGNEARRITCPNCGRASVHFSLDLSMPNTTKWPVCNHRNSCGWYGNFTDL